MNPDTIAIAKIDALRTQNAALSATVDEQAETITELRQQNQQLQQQVQILQRRQIDDYGVD